LMAMAFSYLETGVTYTHAYFDRNLDFRDALVGSQRVKGFGLGQEDDSAYHQVRGQVEILFSNGGEPNNWKASEFVIDLCKYSQPNQIVLARLPRKATLTETLADVNERIDRFAAARDKWKHEFHSIDTLLAPEMHWKIDHRFQELEGTDKPFVNPSMQGLYVIEARQVIAFDMDKRGAQVKSESRIAAGAGGPQHYEFNGPFLLFLKKRDAKHPFFVMWVDNCELLYRM